MGARQDYYSQYWDPYKDYTSELDSIYQAQQAAGPGTEQAAAQLMGQLGGAYAGAKIPGVLSSTLPSSVGPVAGEGALGSIGGGVSSLGAAPLLGVAGGLALGAKGAKDLLQGNKTKGLEGWGGRATLGIATGGLSELARALGVFGHKSTKQENKDRWKGLYNAGKVPDWFVSDPKVNQDMGVDDAKLASGKLGGRDVWATSGMFDTFGKDWATTGNEAQREQVAKKMLDEKLFDTKKGVTYVTNQDRAKSILDEILAQGKK